MCSLLTVTIGREERFSSTLWRFNEPFSSIVSIDAARPSLNGLRSRREAFVMPLYLTGSLVDSNRVQWKQSLATDGREDRMLVLRMDTDLFSVLPGLRSTKFGWQVDMSRLSLTLAHHGWIPRRGTFKADVRPSALAGYIVTLTF